MKDQNDLVKEVLDFLNDYPDRAIRQEFLGNLEFIYGEDEQDWKEMRDDRAKKEPRKERMAAEQAAKKKAKASGSKDKVRRVEVF